jgi:hypothetical protein
MDRERIKKINKFIHDFTNVLIALIITVIVAMCIRGCYEHARAAKEDILVLQVNFLFIIFHDI